MYKIRKSLLNTVKVSYVKDQVAYDIKLNCNEGINPYGYNEEILKNIDLSYDSWKNYNHPVKLVEKIVEVWKPYASVNAENVFLSNGSINSLYTISSMFLSEKPKVLGIMPQFTEYVTNLKALGYEYEALQLKEEDNYEIDVEEFISLISNEHSLIYLDNPNNPTGQFISLENIERIVKRAKTLGVFVLVDEAFADYLGYEMSAGSLINQYENLIVARTFSKGLGLAGPRMGYSICSPFINQALSMLQDPYIFPKFLEDVGVKSLSDKDYLQNATKKIRDTKTMVKESIGNNLKIAVTNNSIPICMLYHKNDNVDLAHEFGKRGVGVISGDDFYGLTKNCVRLRVPKLEEMELLLEALKQIDEIV